MPRHLHAVLLSGLQLVSLIGGVLQQDVCLDGAEGRRCVWVCGCVHVCVCACVRACLCVYMFVCVQIKQQVQSNVTAGVGHQSVTP